MLPDGIGIILILILLLVCIIFFLLTLFKKVFKFSPKWFKKTSEKVKDGLHDAHEDIDKFFSGKFFDSVAWLLIKIILVGFAGLGVSYIYFKQFESLNYMACIGIVGAVLIGLILLKIFEKTKFVDLKGFLL